MDSQNHLMMMRPHHVKKEFIVLSKDLTSNVSALASTNNILPLTTTVNK
jgi:hypothetical protein